jgi:hypothetical protein
VAGFAPLSELAKSIERLNALSGRMDIEFVLPDTAE